MSGRAIEARGILGQVIRNMLGSIRNIASVNAAPSLPQKCINAIWCRDKAPLWSFQSVYGRRVGIGNVLKGLLLMWTACHVVAAFLIEVTASIVD